MGEPLIKEEKNLEIMAQSNAIKVLDQVARTIIVKEQPKDPDLCLVYQSVLASDKLRPADATKVR